MYAGIHLQGNGRGKTSTPKSMTAQRNNLIIIITIIIIIIIIITIIIIIIIIINIFSITIIYNTLNK